jgi:hypothetical protein
MVGNEMKTINFSMARCPYLIVPVINDDKIINIDTMTVFSTTKKSVTIPMVGDTKYISDYLLDNPELLTKNNKVSHMFGKSFVVRSNCLVPLIVLGSLFNKTISLGMIYQKTLVEHLTNSANLYGKVFIIEANVGYYSYFRMNYVSDYSGYIDGFEYTLDNCLKQTDMDNVDRIVSWLKFNVGVEV